MAHVYFALAADNKVIERTFNVYAERHGEPANILVAFPSRRQFDKIRPKIPVGKLIADSGAYSASTAGLKIDLDEFAAWAVGLGADEIYSLDVIGDYKATRKNTEKLWSMGVPAIPTFHQGSPEAALLWCAKHSEKIALGGAAGRARQGVDTLKWVKQVFARVWPKRVHGFGITRESFFEAVPFDSVDSSSWSYATRFGLWTGYNGSSVLRSRGVEDLSVNLDHYRRWEHRSEGLFGPMLDPLRAKAVP